jgi:hypothetical protein
MQEHPSWQKREKVSISTLIIPELAEYICGLTLPDDQIISLLFNPILSAAAEQMKDDIDDLAKLGIDLRRIPLDRLEWDLSHGLRDNIQDFRNTPEPEITSDKGIQSALTVVNSARSVGYALAAPVVEAASRYEQLSKSAQSDKDKRIEVENKMRQLVLAARKTTKRGRSRFNKILRELGIEIDVPPEQSLPRAGKPIK